MHAQRLGGERAQSNGSCCRQGRNATHQAHSLADGRQRWIPRAAMQGCPVPAQLPAVTHRACRVAPGTVDTALSYCHYSLNDRSLEG